MVDEAVSVEHVPALCVDHLLMIKTNIKIILATLLLKNAHSSLLQGYWQRDSAHTKLYGHPSRTHF